MEYYAAGCLRLAMIRSHLTALSLPLFCDSRQLPYKDVYDADACADFVANYIQFEPLEDPLRPPSCLPSPTTVLDWRAGDCFDLATLLCSFLLGAGYDAYCVMGTAPRCVGCEPW